MVKRATIRRRRNAKRVDWYATAPEKENPDKFPCDRCKAYTLSIRTRCQYGMCNEFWCVQCGRPHFGAGPAGCPCDMTPPWSMNYGHQTKGEQPLFRGRVIANEGKPGQLWTWPPFKVIPSKKFSKKRRGWKK